MATTQYIGARYVPLFADPADWNNTRTYEPLTIVLHEGNSFTSKQFVPKGIDISNEEYWANTGNYNSQVEQYRKEVAQFDSRITTADTTANSALSLAKTDESNINTLNSQVNTLNSQVAGTAESGLKTSIENVNTNLNAEIKRASAAEKANTDKINSETAAIRTTPGIEKNIIVILGDSWTANHQGESTTIISTFMKNKALKDYTFKNYGESGAGFVNTSMYTNLTFADELNQFINDSTVDKSKVAKILLIGGCNDVYHYVDTTKLNTATSELFSKIDSLNIPVKWFPNTTAPGCIYNRNAIISILQNRVQVANFGFAYLFNCVGGSFADSRHLTDSSSRLLGNILAENFFSGSMPEVIPRYSSFLNLISFDDSTGAGSVSFDFYNSKTLVINIKYSKTKETTDVLLASLAGTPFALPSSDSPEYTAKYSNNIPALRGTCTIRHTDYSTEVLACFNDKTGHLKLSAAAIKDYNKATIVFYGMDSVDVLF